MLYIASRYGGRRFADLQIAKELALMKLNATNLCRMIFACVAMLITQCESRVLADQQSDIVLIMVDDLRPMLGCYGDTRIKTPNIDRLARRSVVFDRAYCQYAKCGTSRLSLMTGLRPDSIGVYSNRDLDVKKFRRRRPDAISIAKWLRNNGYMTHSFGKIDHDGWQLAADWTSVPSPGREREMWEVVDSSDPNGKTRIADRYSCPVMQSPDVADEHLFAGRMTEQVIRRIEKRSDDAPTFLAVGYRRPHLPFVAPKSYFDLYDPNETWLAKDSEPEIGSRVISWFNSDGYVGSAKRIGLTMPKRPNRQQAIDWNGYELRSYLGVPPHGPIKKELQIQLIHAYAACVSYVDTQIGKVLAAIKKTGRLEKTIIVLCSDHGWHLGEKSAWGKMTNYEIATRVPLMISAPEIQAGRISAPTELVDLYPTICSLANLDAPDHLEGESLLSLIARNEPESRQLAFSQYSRFNDQYHGYAVRDRRFRLVNWVDTKTKETIHRELYDHENDPGETNNVAEVNKYSEFLFRLENALKLQRAQGSRQVQTK